LSIMRKVRDDVGPDRFAQFTELVNSLIVPDSGLVPGINIGVLNIHQEVNNVTGGGQVVGVGVNTRASVRDNMGNKPRQDISMTDAERMGRLTDIFVDCLEEATGTTQAVFLFDHLEKATSELRSWIWGELFQPLTSGRLSSCRFVLCGRQLSKPESEFQDLWPLLEQAELQPLADHDIAEYLGRREGLNLGESDRQLVASWVCASTGGVPFRVATTVEGILEKQRNERRGQEPRSVG
jgi:hypothetical protein